MGAGSTKQKASTPAKEQSEAKKLDEKFGVDRAPIRLGQEAQLAAPAEPKKKNPKPDPRTVKRIPKGGKGATKGGPPKITWRERIARARGKTAQTLTILQAFEAKMSFFDASNFIRNMPFFVQGALGPPQSARTFVDYYTQLQAKMKTAPSKVVVLPPRPGDVERHLASKRAQAKREKEAAAAAQRGKLPGTVKPKPKKEKIKVENLTDVIGKDVVEVAEELVEMEQSLEEQERELQMLNQQAAQKYEEEYQHFHDRCEDGAVKLQELLHQNNADEFHEVPWAAPNVHDTSGWAKNMRGQFEAKRSTVSDFFNSGAVAIQVLAAGSVFRMPDGSKVDLWSSNIYELANTCLGLSNATHSRRAAQQYQEAMADEYKGKQIPEPSPMIDNLPLGLRHLATIAVALERLVGPQQLDNCLWKLKLVLHVTASLEHAVVADLAEHGYFGINPANIALVVQPALPGFCHDTASQDFSFKEDPTSPYRMYGTGFAMQQLDWAGEAFVLSRADTPGKYLLENSVLEWLDDLGVSWVQSNRMNDMRRLNPEQAINVPAFAHTLQLQEEHGACMSIQVESTSVAGQMYERGSAVLGRGDGTSTFVNELCADAIKSEFMQKTVNNIKANSPNNTYVTSIDRYLFYLPALKEVLDDCRFSPMLRLEEWEEKPLSNHTHDNEADSDCDDSEAGDKLPAVQSPGRSPQQVSGMVTVEKELVAAGQRASVVREHYRGKGYGDVLALYPFFDMCDLTHAPKLRCVAVEVDCGPNRFLELKHEGFLQGALNMAYAQDTLGEFHSCLQRAKQGAGKKKRQYALTRYKIVVFCSDDRFNASLKAARSFYPLLKPGIDQVHLVHIVKDSSQIPFGCKLVLPFEPEDPNIEVVKHVRILPDDENMIDFMCRVARHEIQGHVVVMGSEALSKDNVEQGRGISTSHALQMTRKCRQSLFIYKTGGYIPDTLNGDMRRSGWLCAVHQSALALLEFVNKMLDKTEKDQLVFGRITHTPNDEEMSGKLIEAFTSRAALEGKQSFVVHTRGGNPGKKLMEMAEQEQASVLAIQIAQHLEPSESVQQMLLHSPCAFFMFKEKEKHRGLAARKPKDET